MLAHNGEILLNKYEPDTSKTKEQFLEEVEKVFTEEGYSKKIRPMTLEGSVVRLSDIIAYIGRDIEDAIIVGSIKREDVPNEIADILGNNNKDIVNTLTMDVIENSIDKSYLTFSKDIFESLIKLKKWNYEHIYSSKEATINLDILEKGFNDLFYYYLEKLNGRNNIQIEENMTYSDKLLFNFVNNKSDDYNIDFILKPNESGEYCFPFTIENPKLWWPNGSGEQYLYKSKILIDDVWDSDIRYGIRTIELVRKKDTLHNPNLRNKKTIGESFYFNVNGQPVFCKGANFITGPTTKTSDIILAQEANMNMLRVWGGANYGDEEFYNLCDEYGIMVWQDFPFACELYPADSSFLANVKEEATQNIQRISGHPSLALYCGNNEIWEGWNNWGWKQIVKDTTKVVEDYNKLFKELLPELVSEYAPTIDYIHSSPLEYGWGHEESRQIGDCHYWGVWWGDSTFETYTRKVPRFMSEFGFQSAMNFSTAQKYCSSPYTKNNDAFAIHQKHDRGFELIDSRVKEWFGDIIETDEDYITYTNLTAAEGLKLAIEAFRRAKPYCMGILFWQYNELYPCIGWGCIDYSSDVKPTYYTATLSYQPVIFSIDKYSNEDSVFVYACSDIDKEIKLDYTIKILDNNDSLHYKFIETTTNIPANESKLIASIAYKDIKDFDKKTCYLWAEGTYEDAYINNYAFFSYPKDYISLQKYLDVIYFYYFGDDIR